MKEVLEYAEEIIEKKRAELETLNDEIEELEERRAELKGANAVSFAMLGASIEVKNKAQSTNTGVKEIEQLQKEPETIAARTKKELKELTKKLKIKYLQKECLEEQLAAAQRQLEYIEGE